MWKFLSNVLLLGEQLRTALQSGDMVSAGVVPENIHTLVMEGLLVNWGPVAIRQHLIATI